MKGSIRLTQQLLHLMCAAVLMTGLYACGKSEETVEVPVTPEKPTPEVPVNNDDWQTVSPAGGTVEKGDISISFPSGTFDKDAKVAITEVKKGEAGGKYEASTFYQITLPCTTNKSMTIKIKSTEKNDDISFVANSPGFCISTCKASTIETILETKYSNGEYSTTLPAITDNEEDENVYFTLGLGHVKSYRSGNSRTRGLFDEVLYEGKVENLSYRIRFPLKTLYTYDKDTLVMAEMKARDLNDNVQQALRKIFDLGFKIEGERSLDINLVRDKDWGGYTDDWVYKGWSSVSVGIDKLLNDSTTEVDRKCTVIHELFHFVQSGYDPRSTFRKGWPYYKDKGGEPLIMYEMGAVWIENLMNNGQLKASWLNTAVLNDIVLEDRLGLTDINSRMRGGYAEQGYSMGPLLYYLCTSKEMSAFGFDNTSVLELHEQWKQKLKNRSTLEILESWAMHTHDCGIFTGDEIDEYYMMLLSGQLVKGTNMFKFYEAYGQERGRFVVKDVKMTIKPFEGEIYPYGCAVKAVQLCGLKDVPLNNYNLVIKQEHEGMQTYVMTAKKADEKFLFGKTVAKGNDSIVISGKTLEQLRNADGTFDQYFFVVTTRTENSYTDKGTQPYKVTVQLQQCPYEVSMISLLGHFSAIDQKGNIEVHDNLGGAVQESDGTIITTQKGKGLHIEGEAITHPMSWLTYNTHITLDIDDASLIESQQATITKIDMVTDIESEYGSGDYYASGKGQAKLSAVNIPMGKDYAGAKYWMGNSSCLTNYSYYNTTYYSNKTETSTMELVDNASNYIEVWIFFKDGKKARAVCNLTFK